MKSRMARFEEALKGRPCPVCGEARLQPAQPNNYYKIRCNNCGVRLARKRVAT